MNFSYMIRVPSLIRSLCGPRRGRATRWLAVYALSFAQEGEPVRSESGHVMSGRLTRNRLVTGG